MPVVFPTTWVIFKEIKDSANAHSPDANVPIPVEICTTTPSYEVHLDDERTLVLEST